MAIDSFIAPESLSSLPKSEHILLALSGGSDSVCLFHLLLEGGYSFSVAHFNHHIRGDEAKRDAEFCRSLALSHKIEFIFGEADVPAEAKRTASGLEETARRMRYAFLREEMIRRCIRILATAHNATDNAETLVFSLSRGCGPGGACGIAPVREEGGITIIRPLIAMTKIEILSLCHTRGYEYVTDSTNSDTAYTRNHIRHNILPRLEEINPRAVRSMCAFTDALRTDEDYLSGEADRFLEACGGRIAIAPLVSLHPAVAIRVLQKKAYSASAAPERRHLLSILSSLRDGDKCGASMTLPGSVNAVVEGEYLVFKKDNREGAQRQISYPEYIEIPLSLGENEVKWGFGKIVCIELKNSSRQIYNLSTFTRLNIDRIKGQMFLTPRREGDTILYHGHHRRVRRLLSEAQPHIDARTRALLPLIRMGDEIVFLPFIGASDKYRTDSDDAIAVAYIPDCENNDII